MSLQLFPISKGFQFGDDRFQTFHAFAGDQQLEVPVARQFPFWYALCPLLVQVFTNRNVFRREMLQPTRMNHDRIQELATEMCDLLNEQTKWLKRSTGLLIAQSQEEVDGYAQRNDRLCQLGKELSELE